MSATVAPERSEVVTRADEPKILHIEAVDGAEISYCGFRRPPWRPSYSWAEAKDHQVCVVCYELWAADW